MSETGSASGRRVEGDGGADAGGGPQVAERLAALAQEAWDGTMATQPLVATALGDRRFDDRLADNTPEADAADRRRLAGLLVRAQEIPNDALGPADAVTHAALVAFVEMESDTAESGHRRWVIDPIDGPQVELLNVASFQRVETPQDGEWMVARWRAMGPWIDQHLANVLTSLDGGLVSPEAPIRKVVDELDDLLGRPPAEWPLLEPAAADHPDWSNAARARFAADLAAAVADLVRPAFGRYRDALLEVVLPSARPNERPGLAEVPSGADAYRRLARAHTSLDLTPEEIHAIGLAEVERIDLELEALAGRALGTADGAEARARLRGDRGLHFSTSAEVLATAHAALARANAAIPEWFGRLPEASCEIVEMGAHEAKHSTIAYYRQPAVDGSRPGSYYLNTTAPATRPRYEAEALAFHEAVPGHHLQIAIAQELEGLPEFRRHAGPNAFIEGWGLYAERLSDEMGLYTSDLDRIGIASFDGWRACRLVVDTGMHALGWSRDRAIAFMLEHTALAPGNVVNEVDRYISMPGQALAYKLGQLEFLRLRTAAQAALGPRFDIRAFHDVALGQGALPLSTLRAVVGRWVAAGSG
jgi:uncharacterized protein (DUF885 family)